jgi:hypothetical protein
LQSSNDEIYELAVKLLTTLFRVFSNWENDYFRRVFNIYELDRRPGVVRALTVLVSNGDLESTLVQTLIEFARGGLKNETDVQLLSAFVGLGSALSDLDFWAVSNMPGQLVPHLQTLVDSGIDAVMPVAAEALNICVLSPSQQTGRLMTTVYPKLVQFASAPVGRSQARGEVAQRIVDLIIEYLKKKEIRVALDLVNIFLGSRDPILIIAATRMILSLLKLLEPPTIEELCLAMARAAAIVEDERALNTTVEALRRVIRRCRIDEAIIIAFADAILSERLCFFERQPLADWVCPRTSLFSLLTTGLEYYTGRMSVVVPRLIDLAEVINGEMFTLVFDPIASAYSFGLVEKLPTQRL